MKNIKTTPGYYLTQGRIWDSVTHWSSTPGSKLPGKKYIAAYQEFIYKELNHILEWLETAMAISDAIVLILDITSSMSPPWQKQSQIFMKEKFKGTEFETMIQNLLTLEKIT